MAVSGAPENVRYEMNDRSCFYLCRHCRNHIVTKNSSALLVGGSVSLLACRNPVNVRNDPLTSYRYGNNMPVLNVHCNDCDRHLGEQLVPAKGSCLLDPDQLLYWDGSRLRPEPI